MDNNDFAKLTRKINDELSGKTISHATYKAWGVSYSVTLHFTDGTSSELIPEQDEGFWFESPVRDKSD